MPPVNLKARNLMVAGGVIMGVMGVATFPVMARKMREVRTNEVPTG